MDQVLPSRYKPYHWSLRFSMWKSLKKTLKPNMMLWAPQLSLAKKIQWNLKHYTVVPTLRNLIIFLSLLRRPRQTHFKPHLLLQPRAILPQFLKSRIFQVVGRLRQIDSQYRMQAATVDWSLMPKLFSPLSCSVKRDA